MQCIRNGEYRIKVLPFIKSVGEVYLQFRWSKDCALVKLDLVLKKTLYEQTVWILMNISIWGDSCGYLIFEKHGDAVIASGCVWLLY